MKHKKHISLMLALVLTAGILTGCGTDTGASGSTAAPVSSAAQAGSSGASTGHGSQAEPVSQTESGEPKVVRINIGAEPDSLDPWQSAATDTEAIFHNVFEGLCLYDEKGAIIPGIAESWDVSGDGKVYTFHIREGITFHNGKELTSADVLYTYNNLAGMGGEKAVSSKFENIEGFEAPDESTFTVTLKEASASFLALNIVPVLPEGYTDQATHPVGTGPFRFVEYTPSQRVVLEKYEDYYEETRMPRIDRAEIYIMTDAAAVVSALQSGQLDAASVTADDAQVLEGTYDIYNSPQNMVQIFAMNNSAAPFDDVRVRQAVNYAIDKDQIIDSVFGGYATKLYTNFSPVMEVFYNKELEGSYDTDVEKAKALLKEAGYENGFTMTITAPANYQKHIDTAQIIAQQLAAVGITANIETMEWATWLEDVYGDAKYETTIVGLTGKLDPDAVLGRFHTDYPKNFFRFSNAEFDGTVTKALTETDEQARIDEYKRCQAILTEEAAAAFLSDPNLVVACRRDLKGYTFYPVGFLDFSKLYYEE